MWYLFIPHCNTCLFCREFLERVFTPKGDWRSPKHVRSTSFSEKLRADFSLRVSQSKLSTYTHTKTLCQGFGVPANWPMKIHSDDKACCWDFWHFLTQKKVAVYLYTHANPFGTKRHFPLRRRRYPKWRNVHPSCDHHPSRRRRLVNWWFANRWLSPF